MIKEQSENQESGKNVVFHNESFILPISNLAPISQIVSLRMESDFTSDLPLNIFP